MSFLFDSGLLALSIVRLTSLQLNTHNLMGSTCISGRVKQILFLHGPKFVVGMRKALYFPTRKLKIGGTWCFLGGALLVYFAWPLFMTIVQTLTFLDLFGYVAKYIVLILGTIANFGVCSGAIPLASVFLRGLPFIGKFLTLPYARAVAVALAAYFSI